MGIRKYNIKDIKKEFEDRGYILLEDEFVNVNAKMKYICNKHKDKGVQEVIYKTFRKGTGCRFCGYEQQKITKSKNKDEDKYKNKNKTKFRKWSYEDIKKYIEIDSGSNCKLITTKENYQTLQTKITITCSECGEEFTTTAADFLYEERRLCLKCSKQNTGDNYRLSYNEVKQYIESQGYILLSDTYLNNREKLKMLCPEGHEVNMAFSKFKYTGRRCSICKGGVRYTYGQVKRKIEDEPGYKLKSDYYYNFLTDLTVECNEGHEFHTYLQNWDVGARCPICNESTPERIIRDWLESNNISFQAQYGFDDLKGIGGNTLKYDFAVLDSKGNVKLLIEHDGIFHYKNVFKDDYRFNLVQEHDRLKTEYCFKNHIPLLRIPYWESDNIENFKNILKRTVLNIN